MATKKAAAKKAATKKATPNTLLTEALEDPKPNFEFKFTTTDGVKLSKIDIEGNIFRGPALVKASKIDEEGKLVVAVFADVFTTPITMILEAVGEPNRSTTFTLKFENKDVFKTADNKKIKIADNRFGFLALPSVNLP